MDVSLIKEGVRLEAIISGLVYSQTDGHTSLTLQKSDFLFVKSTGEMLRVKSEMYFLV